MAGRLSGALSICAVVVGCSSHARTEQTPNAISVLRAHPTFAVHLSRAIEPSTNDALRTELPERADGAVRLSIAGREDTWLSIAPIGLRSIAAHREGAARVFEGAMPSVDVVHVVEPHRYEETRVLHEASTIHAWSLTFGPGIADVVLRDGLVEAVDEKGRVVFVQDRPFAEDARGTSRTLAATLTGEGRTRTLTLTLDASGLALPIVVDPTWSLVAPIKVARARASATLLPDGRVLVAGGRHLAPNPDPSTAEIYDPVANKWTDAGVLPTVPIFGRLFAVGSKAAFISQNAVDRFDGVSTWTLGAPPLKKRLDPGMVQLADGRIFVVGGQTFDALSNSINESSAEIYDAVANSWTAVASTMTTGRLAISPALGKDGRVYIFGGSQTDAAGTLTGSLSSTDVFDPKTNTFTAGTPMPEPRDTYNVAVAPSGDIEIVQGQNLVGGTGITYYSRRRFHPSTGTWGALVPMSLSLSTVCLPLSDGRFLFPNSVDAILFDPTPDTFVYAGSLPNPYINRTYVALADGRALTASGRDPTVPGKLVNEVDVWSQASLGAACSFDFECKSAHCTDGVCCGVASCGVAQRCDATGVCKGLSGHECTAASECGSGFCVDSVCCDKACGGSCEACDDPFSLGKCKPISGAPHGTTRAACSDGGGNPCLATTCNGTDPAACHPRPAGATACGENACSAGTESHVGTCDATGACVATSKSCGAYACGATTCNTSCTTATDCASGYWCSGGACVATLGLAKPCADSSACNAGLSCVDGVCCGSASCGPGASCALAGHEGSCFVKQGAVCTLDAQCATGFCVDGVCCESKCDGQCEACDVKDSEGTCAAIKGTPHGGRTACDKKPDAPCQSAACDGATRTSCAGLASSDVVCQPQRCEGGTLTPAGLCDGKGGCAKGEVATCSGFTCADGISCRTSCKDDGDCEAGFHCDASKCVAITASCSSDRTQALPTGGAPVSCAPYLCRAGACLTACATSDDCQAGTLCSFGTRTCIEPTAETTSEDGGGCSASRGKANGALLVLFALGAFLARRRWALAFVASTACSPSKELPKQESSPLSAVRAASRAFAKFGVRGEVSALRVSLPSSADAPLHLADPVDPSFFVDVTATDAGPSRSHLVEGAMVHELADATILHATTPGGAEELRVLSPRSSRELHWRVSAGPSVAQLRLREGRVEAVDGKGRVHIGSAPMWAIDAKGTRRDLEVRAEALANRALSLTATLDANDLVFPVVVDPAWTATPSMKYPREGHVAVVMADGRVMEAGGQADTIADTTAAASSAEIFDPVTNTWSLAPSMKNPHGFAGAARLGTKVLVAGGLTNGGDPGVSTADLYDPASSSWSSSTMPENRPNPNVVALPSGKGLVFGSSPRDAAGTQTPSKKSFLFDPVAKTWTASGDMTIERDTRTIAQLPDGTVLALGGFAGGYTSTAEKYNPTSGTWSAIAPMLRVRVSAAAAVFGGGSKVLVAGGNTDGSFNVISSSEIYDVASNTWSPGPPLSDPRDGVSAVTLTDGRVLLAAGRAHNLPTNAWQIFDPSTSKLGPVGRLPITTSFQTMVSLAGGSALLAGGGGGGIGEAAALANAYVFAPQANGAACSIDDECTSAHCTEGVCCSAAACGAGTTCAGVAPGTCTKRDAVPCTANAECASGFCVDGVCCESACTSTCAACDVPGLVGRCRPVKGATHGTRTPCAATKTDCGLGCDGADIGACHPRASGAPCGDSTCSAGMESHPGTCDGAGACNDVPTSCGAYKCGAKSCKTSCTTTADCWAGYACSGSTCVPLPGKGSDCSGTGACGPGLSCVAGVCCGTASCAGDSVCPLGVGDCIKIDGATCAANSECLHGHCVDGFCCNEACDGACGTCNAMGSEGKCVAIAGKPHGSRTCPSDPVNPCSAGVCDGVDKSSCAALPGPELVCRKSSCVDGKATTSAFCDGKGACPAEVTSDCGSYTCNADGTACRTRCSVATDCKKGSWCNAEKCEPLAGTCSADGASLEVSGAGSVSCAPFVCRDNGCITSCTSSAECSAGNVCDTSSSICVTAAPEESSGGCSTSRPGKSDVGYVAFLLVLAFTGRARKKLHRE